MKVLNLIICFIITILIISSCNSDTPNKSKIEKGKTFVLVHGAYHGKWCWDKLIPKIKELGHKAIAIDLPGMGADSTPIEKINFDDYVGMICETITKQENKVILVGHSLGGISISAAAEKCTEHIESLVYLIATVLKNGESLVTQSIEDPNPTEIVYYEISKDGLYAEAIKEKAKEVFYHDCDDQDIKFAIDNLRRQPLNPITEAISVSDARFGTIPKYFIECTNDKIFSIEYQRLLQKQLMFKEVFTMNTGHSPFLSAPEELAGILNKIE